jgi:SRSO17 transposase
VELAVFICLICHFLVLRWRIERDYRELEQEVGLMHYEGRNWRGFHHHASWCIAAYAFLMGSVALSEAVVAVR